MLSAALRSNPHRLRVKYPNLLTVLVVAAATAAQWFLWPYFEQSAFLFYYPTVVLCALFGNALLGLILSCVTAKMLFFDPPFSWRFEDQEAVFMGLFILASLLIWQMGKAMRDTLERSELVVRDLAKAIEARDEFMSIVSHELRTPLTSLKLQNQLRERNLGKGNKAAFSDEKLKRMVQIDGAQIDRLVHLVDDMLDISRIRTGRLSLSLEPTELSALVKDVIDRHSGQLIAACCALEIHCEENLVGNWDRFRLDQVVANLLTNAAKYSAGKPVAVSTHRRNGRAVLIVKDQGMGIAKENQERIFQRFERAISANEVSGLGLGLYIAREILELHNGTITVESELGAGSTFTVTLPLAP